MIKNTIIKFPLKMLSPIYVQDNIDGILAIPIIVINLLNEILVLAYIYGIILFGNPGITYNKN